jgi:hypothetical protein
MELINFLSELKHNKYLTLNQLEYDINKLKNIINNPSLKFDYIKPKRLKNYVNDLKTSLDAGITRVRKIASDAFKKASNIMPSYKPKNDDDIYLLLGFLLTIDDFDDLGLDNEDDILALIGMLLIDSKFKITQSLDRQFRQELIRLPYNIIFNTINTIIQALRNEGKETFIMEAILNQIFSFLILSVYLLKDNRVCFSSIDTISTDPNSRLFLNDLHINDDDNFVSIGTGLAIKGEQWNNNGGFNLFDSPMIKINTEAAASYTSIQILKNLLQKVYREKVVDIGITDPDNKKGWIGVEQDGTDKEYGINCAHAWGANINNYNLPEKSEIDGGNQATAFTHSGNSTQAPGVFGIISTNLYMDTYENDVRFPKVIEKRTWGWLNISEKDYVLCYGVLMTIIHCNYTNVEERTALLGKIKKIMIDNITQEIYNNIIKELLKEHLTHYKSKKKPDNSNEIYIIEPTLSEDKSIEFETLSISLTINNKSNEFYYNDKYLKLDLIKLNKACIKPHENIIIFYNLEDIEEYIIHDDNDDDDDDGDDNGDNEDDETSKKLKSDLKEIIVGLNPNNKSIEGEGITVEKLVGIISKNSYAANEKIKSMEHQLVYANMIALLFSGKLYGDKKAGENREEHIGALQEEIHRSRIDSESRIAQLEREIHATREQFQEAYREKLQLDALLDRALGEAGDYYDEIQRINAEYRDAVEAARSEITADADLAIQHMREISLGRIAEIRMELNKQQDIASKALEKSLENSKVIEELTHKNETIEAELIDAHDAIDLIAAKNLVLTEHNDFLNVRIKTLELRILESEKIVEEGTQTIDGLQKMIEVYQGSLQTAIQDADFARTQASAAKREVEAYRIRAAQYKRDKEGIIDDAASQIDAAMAAKDAAELLAETAERRAEDIQSQMNHAKASLLAAESRLEFAREQIEIATSEKNEANAEKSKAKREKHRAQSNAASAKADKERAEREKNDAQKDLDNVTRRLDDMNEGFRRMFVSFSASNEGLQETTRKLHTALETIKERDKQLKELQSTNTEFAEKLKELAKISEELAKQKKINRDMLAECQLIGIEYEDRIKDLISKKIVLSGQKFDLSQKNITLEQSIKMRDKQIGELQSDNDQLVINLLISASQSDIATTILSGLVKLVRPDIAIEAKNRSIQLGSKSNMAEIWSKIQIDAGDNPLRWGHHVGDKSKSRAPRVVNARFDNGDSVTGLAGTTGSIGANATGRSGESVTGTARATGRASVTGPAGASGPASVSASGVTGPTKATGPSGSGSFTTFSPLTKTPPPPADESLKEFAKRPVPELSPSLTRPLTGANAPPPAEVPPRPTRPLTGANAPPPPPTNLTLEENEFDDLFELLGQGSS